VINARPSCATFEGSPVAKAIEFLRSYSVVEIAAVLSGLADAAPVDEYELLRRASLDLLKLPRGRPPICDDSRSLSEMSRLLVEGKARSVEHAAKLAAEELAGQHSANGAQARLAKKYRRGLSGTVADEESPGQNTDLSLMRAPGEAVNKTSNTRK
jgi:hypothetical protein